MVNNKATNNNNNRAPSAARGSDEKKFQQSGSTHSGAGEKDFLTFENLISTCRVACFIKPMR